MLKNFIGSIKNLITWFPIIWQDQQWDWTYIIILLRKKLIRMEHFFRKHGYHLHANKDADKMKKCILLIDRILKDEYHETAFKKHDEKWGEPEFSYCKEKDGLENVELRHKNIKTKEDKEKHHKEVTACMKCEDTLKKQDLYMLFDILKKNIDSWWD